MMNRILLAFILFVVATPAHAQDYAQPTWQNLVRTLVRFNAIDLNDDKIVDDYAAITECDLYKGMHDDDFKWNKVRMAIRDSVRQNIATFPINYGYETELQFDHYDFHDKEYKFTEKSAIHNINLLAIYGSNGITCNAQIKNLPLSYNVVLDAPVSLDGLPIDEKAAEALLQRMKSNNNGDKILYTRFNLRIIYIGALRRASLKGEDASISKSNAVGRQDARLDGHLDSIDFYEDSGKTKLIYSYHP